MNDPDFQRRLRDTFQLEATEHVRALSRGAFELEAAADPQAQREVVERIFRETHTLKGAARMVAEAEAEALCQVLEQQLSGWKHSGQRISPALIQDLHTQVAELARVLAVNLTPAPAAAPAAAPVPAERRPEQPAATSAATVRVPGERLDALLLRAEEMVAARLTGDQRVATLRELSGRSAAWKAEWGRVRPQIAALRRFVDSGEASPIAHELRGLLHYVEWAHEFDRAWQDDLGRIARAATQDQRRLGSMIDQLLGEAKEVLMQPFSALLEMFPPFVREIAVQQGKEIDLRIEGAETEIDRRVLEELRDALVHLVRNAIDHGIEPAAERAARGKPPRGQLTIGVRGRSGGNVEITVSDDGHGIDPAEVTASARRLGILSPDAAELSDHDALGLLFASGFSTRLAPTELSGRGLGLAIVREKAELIGGTVNVESEPGRGATFRFVLPITLARFRGVFVGAAQQAFVVPSAYVRRVLRVRESQLRRVKHQALLDVDGASVVLLELAQVLGAAETRKVPRRADPTVFAVVVESGRSRVALRVDEVPYEQEVVMKSLGPMLRRAPHYVGATIVGGGQIVPVLNVSNLVTAAVRRGSGRRAASSAAPAAAGRPKRRILVAEDSITSRSLLKNILQTAGFEVRTAVDGADALTTLKFEPVDLLISDVQMPRMDGFELTAKVRADPQLSTLPVILITSLASRDDKARGVQAGANAYLVKSSFDQSDMLEAIRRLLP